MNAYDRASSVLTASLTIVSLVVMGLAIVYFTSRVVTVTAAIPVEPVSASNPNDAARGAGDQGSPGMENAPEEVEPDLSEKLNVLEGIVSSQLALFDESATDQNNAARGDGLGDARSTDSGGTGRYADEPVRELRYEPDSLAEYAKWMDSAGIELGVLGGDNRVHYAAQLSQEKPNVRDGDPAEESRLYFNTRGTPLEPLDLRLARKAGISDRGEIILLFCGPETTQRLLSLEKQSAGDRPISQVSRTVFRVQRGADGFQLSVEEQQYRS